MTTPALFRIRTLALASAAAAALSACTTAPTPGANHMAAAAGSTCVAAAPNSLTFRGIGGRASMLPPAASGRTCAGLAEIAMAGAGAG